MWQQKTTKTFWKQLYGSDVHAETMLQALHTTTYANSNSQHNERDMGKQFRRCVEDI